MAFFPLIYFKHLTRDNGKEEKTMQEDFHPEEAKITNDEKNTGILIHILGLFLGIISPLIFYLVKKGF